MDGSKSFHSGTERFWQPEFGKSERFVLDLTVKTCVDPQTISRSAQIFVSSRIVVEMGFQKRVRSQLEIF